MAVVGEVLGDLLGGVGVAGDDDGGGSVDGGEVDAWMIIQNGADVVFAGLDGDHDAAGWGGVDEGGAGGDEGGGVGEGEDAGGVGGGDFSDGVAGEVVGVEAPVGEEVVEGGLEGEEGGLGVEGVVEVGGVGVEDDVAEGAEWVFEVLGVGG